MASTLKNAQFKKTSADAFPDTEDVVFVSAINATVSCAGQNSVSYLFLDSGETGVVEAGETVVLIANSDAIADTIRFTWSGSASIEVAWVNGVGSSTNDAVIINRLDIKQGAGIIWDLTMEDSGTSIEFPLSGLITIQLVWGASAIGNLGFVTVIDLGGMSVLNKVEFCKFLNGAQPYMIFSPLSGEEFILIQTNLFNVDSLIEIIIDFSDDVTTYTSQAFVYDTGDLFTSNLDGIFATVKEINSTVRSLVSNKTVRIFTITDPNLTFVGMHQSITFVVPDLASSIVVTTIPLTGGTGTSVTYPIIGTAANILGDTLGLETFKGSKVTIAGTGLVYLKLISPSKNN